MTKDHTPDPRYSFPKPPEWEDLVARADAALIPGRPKARQGAAVNALWDALPNIDPEAQERNRYFGLGLVVCKLSKSCFLPADTPGSIIPDMVDTLVRAHPQEFDDGSGMAQGLTLGEILLLPEIPASKKTRSAYTELSLAERLTIDTLQQLTIEKSDWEKRSEASKNFYRRSILEDDDAFNSTKRNVFAAASGLFRTSVRQLVKKRTGLSNGIISDTRDLSNIPIKALLSEEEIRTLVPPATAAQATQLHLNEFTQHLEDFIYPDEAGVTRFNKSAMPKTPNIDPDSRPRHRQRIKCPALYVAGAIAFAANAMPEIIIQAQHHILSKPPLKIVR